MRKDNDIIRFINDFTSYESNSVLYNTFMNGYCYYFAVILKERFGGIILYDPIDGHFVTKIDGSIYDITGDVTAKHKTLYGQKTWSKTPSIIEGCINKVCSENI